MRNHRNHRFFLKYPIFRRKKNGKDLMNIRHGHWCCSCQTHEERWHIQLIWDLPWSRWMIYFLRCQWSECLINPQESKMDKPEKCQEFSRFSRTLGSTWRWKTSSHYMQSLMATVKKVGGFQIWNHHESSGQLGGSLPACARSWRVSLCQGQLAEDHVGGLVLSFPTHPAARSAVDIGTGSQFFQVAKCKLQIHIDKCGFKPHIYIILYI